MEYGEQMRISRIKYILYNFNDLGKFEKKMYK